MCVILLFFIISQKSIYFAHFYDIFFVCLHISNNISRDITLPDFLCCTAPLSVKTILPILAPVAGFSNPPTHQTPLLSCYYLYYCTCEPRNRQNRGGRKVALGFLYYSRSNSVKTALTWIAYVFGNRISESRRAL